MNPNKMGRLSSLPVGTIGLCREKDGDTKTHPNPMLDRLYAERDGALAVVASAINGANEATRDLSDAENKLCSDTKERVSRIDSQIKLIEDHEASRAAGDAAAHQYGRPAPAPRAPGQGMGAPGGARTSQTPYEYKSAGEFVRDLVCASQTSTDTPHGFTRVDASTRERAQARLMTVGAEFDGMPDQYRAFVHGITDDVPALLPKPIIGPIVNNLDAARPFIQSIGAKDLGGVPGKVFTRPHITQHVDVQKQTAEKAEVVSRKLLIAGIDFTKETWGGGLNVSRQDIDWTSPSAWDAIVNDLQEVYGLNTENAAADAFNTAVVAAPIVAGSDDLRGYFDAIYAAAALAYAGSGRMPNHMWMSLDMWATVGPVIDSVTRQNGGGNVPAGSSSPASFAGVLADLPRTVVPSFAAGTFIIGVKERTEFYEERIGLLTAVQPSLLGVEVAYGGYAAYGTLTPAAFAKVGAAV